MQSLISRRIAAIVERTTMQLKPQCSARKLPFMLQAIRIDGVWPDEESAMGTADHEDELARAAPRRRSLMNPSGQSAVTQLLTADLKVALTEAFFEHLDKCHSLRCCHRRRMRVPVMQGSPWWASGLTLIRLRQSAGAGIGMTSCDPAILLPPVTLVPWPRTVRTFFRLTEPARCSHLRGG